MSNLIISIITGIPIGTAVGIAIQQKSWPEFSGEEKRFESSSCVAKVQ